MWTITENCVKIAVKTRRERGEGTILLAKMHII